MADLLPPLPVDDVALDFYWSALHPDPEAERSSLCDVLDIYARMAGSDPDAIEEVLHRAWDGEPDHMVMRDAVYHPNDLVAALITEVRRLRVAAQSGSPEGASDGR